ncbi:MAG: acyl carrier protein [Opitutales bacterium]|nr:acyl carrier protein [Opitutales bacterium]
MQNNNFTPEMEETLRESLKRCSPETIEAAIEFRKTGDISKINTVVLGVLARFVEPDKRKLLENPSDDMVLAQDLNLDSLTMVEIVLAVEDATGIAISNEEVQSLRTLGDVKSFIEKKANA